MGKSHQAGWVALRGKQWYGYFRRQVLDPKTKKERAETACIKLGLKSQMTRSQREKRCGRKLRSRQARISGAES